MPTNTNTNYKYKLSTNYKYKYKLQVQVQVQDNGARLREVEGFEDDVCRKRSSQSVLYNNLAKSYLDRLIDNLQSQVNPSNPCFEERRAE